MQEEEEATLLMLGCLTGGLGVPVLVALVGGLVVRGRRVGGGGAQQDYTSVEVRSSSASGEGEYFS